MGGLQGGRLGEPTATGAARRHDAAIRGCGVRPLTHAVCWLPGGPRDASATSATRAVASGDGVDPDAGYGRSDGRAATERPGRETAPAPGLTTGHVPSARSGRCPASASVPAATPTTMR